MALTASELSSMREAVEDLLPDTCVIQSRSWQSDGMGGGSYIWTDAYTDVPCRLAPRRFREREAVVGDKLSVHSFWVLTLPHDQEIDETMRVVVGGETYEVVSVNRAQSERVAVRADLVKVS